MFSRSLKPYTAQAASRVLSGGCRRFALMVLLCLSLCTSSIRAELRLPLLLSDHAVLQRARPIHIWGWADPQTVVAVSFHNQHLQVTSDRLGGWSTYLEPEAAGGPYDLLVSGAQVKRIVHDILVGEVWLASGQSNMEMPLAGFPGAPIRDSETELANSANSRIRLLLVDHMAGDFPARDIRSSWTECNPDTAKRFSALAYFFAKEVLADQKVPVGVIDASWGGTPAESWTSLEGISSNPGLIQVFRNRAESAKDQADVGSIVAAEQQEDKDALQSGRPLPAHPWHPPEAAWEPAALFNAMIAPLTPFTIKGFLWYQGESNATPERASGYGQLFNTLIQDWRSQFGQGALPFLFVQLSSYESPGNDWGQVRDWQRRALGIANTGMAVTLDVGEPHNIHPADKQTVSRRLSLAARTVAYGENVPYQGPTFREVSQEEIAPGRRGLRVWFDHGNELHTKLTSLRSFEVAGKDHIFKPALANVVGTTVQVSSAAVSDPVYVRYAYANVAKDILYNAEGLPAPTFSSEPFPSP